MAKADPALAVRMSAPVVVYGKITLVGARATACSPPALGFGEHNLVAVHPGSADSTGSMSAPQALTVVR